MLSNERTASTTREKTSAKRTINSLRVPFKGITNTSTTGVNTTDTTTGLNIPVAQGFRSGLEEKIAAQLKASGIDPKFETLKLPYRVEKNCTYTPDFPVGKRIIIETKGRFQTADVKTVI